MIANLLAKKELFEIFASPLFKATLGNLTIVIYYSLCFLKYHSKNWLKITHNLNNYIYFLWKNNKSVIFIPGHYFYFIKQNFEIYKWVKIFKHNLLCFSIDKAVLE